MADIHGSFFNQVEYNYGHDTARHFKDYASHNAKLCNATVRKDFLLECRRKGVFPAHIINTMKCIYPLLEEGSPYVSKLEKIINRFKKSLLNIEIQHTFHKIKTITQTIVHARRYIETSTNSTLSTEFVETQHRAFITRKANIERNTRKKLNRLLHIGHPPDTAIPTVNEKAIFNATDVPIPIEM